ncbi:hypothetical protein RB195_020556 [Necator americanus]|uniref:Uncharacterized protein n=1 Tax=Necator americanus TaxID=51031 RepID=A0ABR1CL57_NECAM
MTTKLRQSLYATLAAVAFIAIFTLTVNPVVKIVEPMKKSMVSGTVLESDCQCTANGQRFNCEYTKHLTKLGLLSDKNIVDLETQQLPDPAFVTAMSENHYGEGLTLIANFRKMWPQRKLYVYDLGLSKKSLDRIKAMCLIEVRQFPFDDYPPYVETLSEYRWKPLIIAQTLNEFGAIWYMDSSVRWKKDKLNVVYNEVTCRKDGTWKLGLNLFNNATTECRKSAYLLHSSSGHGVFPTTNPGVYIYIPTELEKLKSRNENHDAGFAFAVKTIDTVQILKWYVLCALEKNCMGPPHAQLTCSFGKNRFTEYAKCHRYDQSVINLLLSNANGYNSSNYVSSLGGDGAGIERDSNNSLTDKDFLCNGTKQS